MFSFNLITFQQIKDTTKGHFRGELAHFNNTIIALAGEHRGKTVEMLEQEDWNNKKIPSIRLVEYSQCRNVKLFDFSTITLTAKSKPDVLLVIGKFILKVVLCRKPRPENQKCYRDKKKVIRTYFGNRNSSNNDTIWVSTIFKAVTSNQVVESRLTHHLYDTKTIVGKVLKN